ncbi:aminotransferase class I/II-fold pyridoxal phosphate-dependent enzyme [Streptomyces sp. NPDC056661]|uniref:aminotransferase class I/II-fold pyridoxal phosphate-dependent enzyme n=1 Tax=Streptomyces sp. NPDC056661 TaxID=3345898 RepID=UPI0036806A59
MKRRTADSRLNLSSNELHHPRLGPVLAAALNKIDPVMLYRYPTTAVGIAQLAEHFRIRPDGLLLTPGSDSAIRLICDHYAAKHPGGDLLLQFPNYSAWELAADQRGLEVHRLSGSPEEQAERLCTAARACQNALVAVSVPNGPCGWSLSDSRLAELTEIADQRGHLLVVDSCYQAFSGDLTHHLANAGGPVVVVQSLSKSHGLAGARIGVLAGEPKLIAELGESQLEQAVSGPTVHLAVTLLAHGGDELRKIWADIARVRDRTAEHLNGLGLAVLPSGGNFLALDIGSAQGAGHVTVGMSQRGYRVRDLSDVDGFEGYVRLTIADAETTADAVAALQAVLSTLSVA